jgi:hypothetical protein
MKKNIVAFILIVCAAHFAHAQVWQWSVKVDSVVSGETKDHPRAFLWIPENCKQVRAVVFAQHNMIEEGILEHPAFRKTMTELGFAEIWVTPGLDITFDFTKNAGEDFSYMMRLLAGVSGYAELENVSVIPMGHSAYASFPWNFAAWCPSRTLALLSVHGDAPLTKLTGSGRPNPNWGNRNIDGVPSLFIMGEYEWWEDRIQPGFDYVSKHPLSPISFLADAGHGHFDYSDEMVEYLCMFIRKAAEKRLPAKMWPDRLNKLKRINPARGWLMDRWRKDSLPQAPPAPYSRYKGNKKYASWIFDKQIADETEKLYAAARGKTGGYIGFVQNGEIVPVDKSPAGNKVRFLPLKDGISFNMGAFFADTSRMMPISYSRDTSLSIDRICGPVKKVNDTTFQISFYRMGFDNPKRSNDIWLLAHSRGSIAYKSVVQQLDMRFPLQNKEGREQSISFPLIANQAASIKSITLNAVSDAGLPVTYYIKEGPAFIEGNKIVFTKIPPRSKFPIKITIVAWQYGTAHFPKIKSADPVEQTFYLNRPAAISKIMKMMPDRKELYAILTRF